MKIKLIQSLVMLTIGMLFVGCATQSISHQQYQWLDRVDFNEQEYEPYDKTGDNEIVVQGLSRTQGGNIKLSAGNLVFLSPATSYSDQYVEVIIKAAKGNYVGLKDKADKRVNNYIRSGTCDGNGSYIFHGLPDGNYYVYTQVDWSVDGLTQGGWVYNKFSTEDPAFPPNTLVITKRGRGSFWYDLLYEAGIKENIPFFKVDK
jgi:hypothetical protein